MPILQWLTREEDVRAAEKVPYRLLEEDSKLGYGDKESENLIIQGDNLHALKSLLPFYAGQVKCVYIDPPFNTGQAFPNYDDNLEHTVWLGMIFPRIQLLHELLAEDGTMFIHLDDTQLANSVTITDEIFGRINRVNICTFKQGAATGHKAINPGPVTVTNYLLVYAKNKSKWRPNRLFTPKSRDRRYSQFITNVEDHYKKWNHVPLSEAFAESRGVKPAALKKQLGKNYENELSSFVVENASAVIRTARPDYESVGQAVRDAIDKSKKTPGEVFHLEREAHSDMYFRNGERILFYKDKLKQVDGEYVTGEPLTNLWDDLLSNNLHNEGGVKFPKGKKPEALIKRILDLSTQSGDLVLDSFLGSGTTAAVAHKMNRSYIGVEMREHAITHCVPRLQRIVDGENTGVSKAVSWQGGGGFRFCRLGAEVFDETGAIRPDIKFPVLAAHVWFSETRTPLRSSRKGPLLGVHGDTAVALLYNGVLGDIGYNDGNVLNRTLLRIIRDELKQKHPDFEGKLIVYGERSGITPEVRKREKIEFKQTPYDVKARR